MNNNGPNNNGPNYMSMLVHTTINLNFLFKMQNPNLSKIYAGGKNRIYCKKSEDYLRKLNPVAVIEINGP